MKTYGDDHDHPGCHGCQICFGNDPEIVKQLLGPIDAAINEQEIDDWLQAVAAQKGLPMALTPGPNFTPETFKKALELYKKRFNKE